MGSATPAGGAVPHELHGVRGAVELPGGAPDELAEAEGVEGRVEALGVVREADLRVGEIGGGGGVGGAELGAAGRPPAPRRSAMASMARSTDWPSPKTRPSPPSSRSPLAFASIAHAMVPPQEIVSIPYMLASAEALARSFRSPAPHIEPNSASVSYSGPP